MSYSGATIVAAPNEFKVPYTTHVPISKVQFSKECNQRLLAVSGWDGTVHIYAVGPVGQIEEKRFYFHGKSVLACTFAGYNKVASGGLDQIVRLVDIDSGRETNLGTHAMPVRCMEYSSQSGLIVSGGWDSQIKLWDARSYAAAQVASASGRVYALDVNKDMVLVGTKERKIHIFDIRRMDTPIQTRESPLKYQTRAVAFFPKADAFVVSSIEGRVAVEYVDQAPEEQKKKYAFKCHRGKDTDGTELIYPVNALAFHPKHGTFATGGSDSMVNIWDPFNRKRIIQLHKFETTIASLSFNEDGTQLAIASSYCYESEVDPVPLPPNTITIRAITETESRPK
ncbi:unnamed protein product [Caenorhabditis auriculariae]|uniref:Uncharacterized protein n=1 Tax=Caenorhabditis auriculariae TaxID=2777116 RepID=A0A8S1HTV7_9PELO|nr:unnamed protein product [Caenorhabditis auriculariae]